MKLWNWMGGRRNTMVWAAFFLASACLFVNKVGKPIATFTEWAAFTAVLIGLLVAGIVTEEKFKGDKETEIAKATGVVQDAPSNAEVKS